MTMTLNPLNREVTNARSAWEAATATAAEMIQQQSRDGKPGTAKDALIGAKFQRAQFPRKSKAKPALHLDLVIRCLDELHRAEEREQAEARKLRSERSLKRLATAGRILDAVVGELAALADDRTWGVEPAQLDMIRLLRPALDNNSIDVPALLRVALEYAHEDGLADILGVARDAADAEAAEAAKHFRYTDMNRWASKAAMVERLIAQLADE